MPKRSKIDEHHLSDRVIALRSRGHSHREIAGVLDREGCGVSHVAVGTWLRAHPVQPAAPTVIPISGHNTALPVELADDEFENALAPVDELIDWLKIKIDSPGIRETERVKYATTLAKVLVDALRLIEVYYRD